MGPSWDATLAGVPIEVLTVPESAGGLGQLHRLRDFWSAQGVLRPAIAATRALLGLRIQAVGKDHPDALMELAALGALVQRAGGVREGGQMLEHAWTALRARVGGRDLRLAVVAANVARHEMHRGRLTEAEHALEIAYRVRIELAPGSEGAVAAQLGEVRMLQGRTTKALGPLRQAHAHALQAYPPEHPHRMTRAQMLGSALNTLEQWDEAVEVLLPVGAALAADAPAERRATVDFELGLALHRGGRIEEGLRHIDRSVRLTRDMGLAIDEPHPSLPNRLTMMSQLHVQRGRPVEAEGLQLEALEAERRLYGDSSAEVAQRYATLGYFYARLGRADEAMGWLDPACSLLRSTLGDDHPRTRTLVEYFADQLRLHAERALDRRDRQLAVDVLARAWELAVPVLGHGHESVRRLRLLRERLS